MDPATLAMLASIIAGGVSGATSNLGKGAAGSTGYDVLNFNDPNDQYQRQAAAAYMMDQLNSLRAGQAPDWLNRFGQQQQDYLQTQNRNAFFGKEGQSGGSIADAAMSAGAQTGVGGGAAQAPINKALSDYADRMSGINQYISSLKANYMTGASQAVPTELANMSSQKNQVIPVNIPGSNGSPAFTNMGAALGNVDWSKLFQGGQQQVVPQMTFSSNNQFQTAPYSGQYQ